MENVNNLIGKCYGRMRSRKLTSVQAHLFETLFQSVSITAFSDLVNVQTYSKIFVEVGFGYGEHIAQFAMQHADALFIGCEPFVNGIASLLAKIDRYNIKNIRIFRGDAKLLINEVSDNLLTGIFLLFPDPWPKRRHIQRRVLQEDTLVMMHNKLRKSGMLRVATDHPEYQSWVRKLLTQAAIQGLFEIKFFDSNTRPSEQSWPRTRYEQKALENIMYIEFTKV
ncbi:MAG: tRNA (guanosine(46)-N7)-methyltransferase TrmB [Holosporales bacterium]|jgi:tRNA (guanine-N(7)-)-methyltransferase|nr:tRNA (guanosine(46)-N7)-methyltransferase TrmB [Holosporales bacterium]